LSARSTSTRDHDVAVLNPSDLTPDQIRAWLALCDAHEDYVSPLLSPEFARLAAIGRDDARVAMISDEAGLACAFAFYQRPLGQAWPIGAPFCDYTALVVRQDADLTLPDILDLSGVSSFTTRTLLDPWDKFTHHRHDPVETQVIRLGTTKPSVYLETQRQAFPKRFKNFRRLDSRLKRTGHTVELRWGPMDAATREQLFSIKSDQFRQNGLVDILNASRSRPILDATAASPGGFQISLWSGDKLMSGHFGLRQGGVFHPWIAGYDPEFAEYSPGNLMLMRAVAAMPEMGLETYDLAEGHDHYKKYYTNSCRKVWSAEVTAPGAMGGLFAAGHGLWAMAGGRSATGPISRLRRRLDHSGMCEARLTARLADLGNAIRIRRVRGADLPHESVAAAD